MLRSVFKVSVILLFTINALAVYFIIDALIINPGYKTISKSDIYNLLSIDAVMITILFLTKTRNKKH